MKKFLFSMFVLSYFTIANGSGDVSNDTFVVCKPIKSTSETHLMMCELIETSSLRSIDKWIATIP